MGRLLLGVGLALAAAGVEEARAGAWVAPEGGQEIWTNAAGQREGLSFFETSAYWEAPVSQNASFVAAPWVEQNYDTLDGWRGEATLAFKHTVHRGDDFVVAAQAGALWISHPVDGCSEGGGEVRVLGGMNVSERAFVNVEAASRALEGGCESERLDLTAGYRHSDRWMTMAQVFVDAPHDAEDEVVRGQLTVVRFNDRGRGIQVGVRARIDDGPQEAALVIGWWGRPGD